MVEVRARVTSQLEKVHFIDGADVKKGDPLFDLDSRQFDAELKWCAPRWPRLRPP